MLSVEEYEKRLESGEQYAPVTSNVGSLLSVYDTMDFQQKQTTSDKALNLGKSVYNGFMSVPRGVLRGVQWLRDVNEAQLNEANPERMQMDEGARQLLDDSADAEFLQPYEVRADSSAERFAYDLAQGAGQLGGQIAVGLATGGYGTLPAMALQIGGEEYKELREQGIDVETAGKAAAFNAAVQTPLEFIGFSKLTKAFPSNSMLKQRLRHVAEDALTEGITEYLQEYPEQLSKIWAENDDKSPEEIAQIIWDKLGNIHSSATYSGLIGATLGTGAGGIHLALDHKLDRSIERAMQREVYTEMTEHVDSTVNRIKETGINPQYAAAVVNDNTQNQTVYVDGEALAGYAQEKGAEKVAESLGVSVEEIEKAAASGDTVDVKLGNFEATCAAFDGFFQEVKDGTAFEDGGYTPKKEQAEQEQIKRDRERYAEIRDQFKAEEDRIISEFAEAGVGKQFATGQVELLRRFAENINPDYALAIMQSYKVRRGENGEVQTGYGQFAGENAETADKVKLAEAQKMESEGKAADEIYKATGWFKGLDNRWRFEIPDNLNDIDFSGVEKFGELPLARVYYNEALLDAYPQLREVKVVVDDNLGKNTSGETSWENRIIRLNKSELKDKNEAAKTIVHEVQHLIQDIEEHAAGGSPKGIKGFLRAHIKALTKVSKEMQKANPSFARLTKAIDGLGKAAKAQAENPRSKAERDAVSAAFQELKEARNELSAEEKEKLEPLAWRIRELTRAVNSQAKAYDLYRRLGGEQEAREAEARAEDREQLRQDAEAARQYLNDAAQQASGAEQKTLAKLLELRDKFFEDDTLTDEQYDDLIEQMEELKEDLGEELFDKYEQYEEADEAYRTYEEDVMPEPHKADAIIIFNGVEMPYRQKQDESLAGEKTAAEKFFVEKASDVDSLGRITDDMQLEDIRERLLHEENEAVFNAYDYYVLCRDDLTVSAASKKNAYEKLLKAVEDVDEKRRAFNNEKVIESLDGILRSKITIREGSNLEKDLSGDYTKRAGDFQKKNAGASLIPGEYGRIYNGTKERKALFDKIRNEIREREDKERREQAQQQNNRQAKSRSKESGFFDAVKSLMQTNGEIKGEYNPYDNVVTMFKGADASTVIHETWHFFVEQMWNMVQSGNASEQTVKDFETLLSYAGMTMDEWAAADLDGRRKAHEKLAEAGETYIMEGKSPSYELRRVFRNFAKWLKAIYATIQRSENYAELTDDVREVFDRMLAAEDDIAHMERVNGYFSKLPDVITDNMSDETRAKVEDYIEKAREKAVDILTRRSLVNYTKERRKEIKKFKDEIRPMVEDEVSKRPVYACGYDKKDAARFRELRNQQESVGIWTDEKFIDRAFPVDTNPVENEIAHWAAVLNPKNWTKGLGEVKKEYQRQADEILQPAIDVLESGMGQGVETLRETNMFGEAKGDIVGRVSNNARWYQEFYAEHKRRPTKTELREMARQLVSGDVNAPQVEGWMPTTAEEAEAMQAEGERLADIERHIAACDEIKEKLAEVKENYSETSAAGSEEFLFQAELTAERYGYSSADEMMQDIEKSPTKAEAVKQRINERVQELTMQDERNNYEAMIRESLYNEDEALLIGVEQQLIEEYAAKAKERQEANERKAEERAEQRKVNAEVAAARKQQAKNAAQADLAKMNVKEATRTSKFITAERNAAMKCAKLLAQKKFDEALTQKNLQAYWHAMVSESMKIARRQKQNEKFLKRQVGLKREAWLNETHFVAISQLFVRMGIAKPIHIEAAAQSQFENLGAYAAAMETQFDCVDIAPWILEGSTPISDTNALTLEQNEDVVNAVKNIKAIVKAQKGVNTFNKENTWAETKALMMQKLSELKTIWTPNPNKPTKATAMERFTASMETLDSFLEYLDDATYGWFSQTWGNIIKRASDKEYEYREAYDKANAEALKKWLPDKASERAANEEVYYDELGNSVTKHTLVKMLINLGNKENSQRLCETVPVGFERSNLWIMPDEFTDRQTAAEQTRRNLIDFLGRVLTKEDVEYAQRKIDAAEMFWGEKNELEKRVKGFGLKKVEATPVELSINGESVVLRGGYFPLMRNGETGSHAASAEVQDDDPLQGRRIRTYHTNTSATKARTNARYPVNLFLGAETQWIYESIHDLCWRETMNDFRRVLNDQELFAMLKSKIGVARMQVFKEMLEVCADPLGNSKSFSEGERMLGAAVSWLRQRTSHAAIMLNFKVIAQNYANALLYGNAIEGYTMADNLRALGTYMLKYHTPGSHKEMVDFVFSKSSFLRERCELPDITVRDIVNEKKEFAWEKAAREIGIKAMAMTDNATAIPNWLTAYNKKLNEGATEQEAIDYADALVRRVLGSSRITDVASIQRGGDIMKLMTMFQSFFNARYNEFLRMERLASKQWTQGQKMEAFANVASYVVSKWLGQTMLAMALALQNPFDVDDEDKWPELIKELKSYSFSMLGPIGQIGNAIAGSIAGMHEYTYRMSAVESTIENVNRSIKRIHSNKATTQDKVEGIVNTATLFVGVPAQLNRIFWNGVDILLNGMAPEIGDIMRRRPKKERK